MKKLSSVLSLALVLCSSPIAQESPKRDVAKRVAGLIGQLSDDKTWDAAAGGLVLIGAPAAEPLGDALETAVENGKHQVVTRIFRTLDRMGLDAEPALPQFWRALENVDGKTAVFGWQVSLRIAPIGDRNTINRLRKSLEVHFRRPANTRDILQAIKSNLRSHSRRAAVDSKLGVQKLKEKLAADSDNWVSICQLLGRRGEAAKTALPALLEVLITGERRSSRTRRRPGPGEDSTVLGRTAAEAILAIDPRCEEAAFAYGYLMNRDTIRSLRLRSARELQMLGHHVERALPMLITALRQKSADPEILGAALNCLAMTGAKAETARPELERLAKSKNGKIARRAAAILERLKD